jgi:hypothetical protein
LILAKSPTPSMLGGRRWSDSAPLSRSPDKVPEDRLSFDAEPEAALAGVDFVHENAPERVEVKRALLARLEAALPSEVIIDSSSSGLLMSRLQADCRQPRVPVGDCHPGTAALGHQAGVLRFARSFLLLVVGGCWHPVPLRPYRRAGCHTLSTQVACQSGLLCEL